MATAQLQITSTGPGADKDWKLDRRTIEIGRAGLAQAREALSKANPVALVEDPPAQLVLTISAERSGRSLKARSPRPRRVSEGQGALFPTEGRLAA